MAFDPVFVYANYAEACLWVGLGVAAMAKRPTRAGWALGGALIAFGVSDVVETRTGAWYDPWWLLAWKAACVVLILAFGWVALRRRRLSGSVSPDAKKEGTQLTD